MTKNNDLNTEKEELKKERIAAAIFTALVQHGTIQYKHPKHIFVKKESGWKKRLISGLR